LRASSGARILSIVDIPTVDSTFEADAGALLPLTPAVFNILLALADGASHGYAIMREVEALTGGRTRLGPGTLYRSVQRMLVDGLIVELAPAGDDPEEDERRRRYRVTPLGEAVTRLEARRLADLVDAARARGVLPPAADPTSRARRG
jgi:DNA-binding PadR family transcriptional regulator